MGALCVLVLAFVAVGATAGSLPAADVSTAIIAGRSAGLQPRPRQYPSEAPYTAPEACLDVSLSWPRWFLYDPLFVVYNYDDGGRRGNFGFAAYNTGTRKQASCSVKDVELVPSKPGGQGTWYNCSLPDTQFWFDLDTFRVGLRQQWACDNKTGSLKFAGNGEVEIPFTLGCYDEQVAGKGTETTCLMSNADISMSLTSPVVIQPVPPYLTWYDEWREDRCVDRSGYPSWKVADLTYHYSGPNEAAHALSFNLTNLSNDVSIACKLALDTEETAQNGDAERWVACTTPRPTLSLPPIVETRVRFDLDYGLLVINQTWRCTDGIPGLEPDTFGGVAYLVEKLACTDEAAGAYTCIMPPANVTGYELGWEPLWMPHTTYTHSCTLNSFNSTSLVLSGYEIDTTVQEGSTKSASFTIYNPATLDTYRLRDMVVRDDGAWHTCQVSDMPWQLVECEYVLNRATNYIGFRFQWYCDDRDPSHAVLFNATAAGNFPKEVCGPKAANESPQTGNACRLPADLDVELEIQDRSWLSTPGPMDRGPQLPWI